MPTNRKLWSVTRIKHPKHPGITVRVGEYEPGGTLHVFRWDNAKRQQVSRSLKCRRVDLGATKAKQEERARQMGCEIIEALAIAPVPSREPDRSTSKGLTLAKLADKYSVDGFHRSRSDSYKGDALAAVRRVAAFLGEDMLVADLRPSHVEKCMAPRIDQKRAPAGRGDLVALSIAWNWAVSEGLITEDNPLATKRAKDAMQITHKKSRPAADTQRFDKLKSVARQLPPAFEVLLDLAWHTGHRISAILGLRWQDVSTKDATIRWYADVVPDRKKHDHTTAMNAKALATLKRWEKRTNGIGRAWVFPAPTDPTKPLERWVAKQWLWRAERLAELPHVKQGGWHMFRRGWATERKHLPLLDVAAGGGWTDTATVLECYQRPDEDTTRKATTYVA